MTSTSLPLKQIITHPGADKVHKAVVIPMIDYVPDILAKYNYELPKVPSYKFNERLKELGKLAKLKQKVEIVRKKGVNRVAESMFKKNIWLWTKEMCTCVLNELPRKR